jgi:hypothetical protein
MLNLVQLFDQSGGAASGSKQDAVNGAGSTIMKLLLKSQVSGVRRASPACAAEGLTHG